MKAAQLVHDFALAVAVAVVLLLLPGCAAVPAADPSRSITLTDEQYDQCQAQRGCVVISRMKLIEIAKKLCDEMGSAE